MSDSLALDHQRPHKGLIQWLFHFGKGILERELKTSYCGQIWQDPKNMNQRVQMVSLSCVHGGCLSLYSVVSNGQPSILHCRIKDPLWTEIDWALFILPWPWREGRKLHGADKGNNGEKGSANQVIAKIHTYGGLTNFVCAGTFEGWEH